ncbi:unnamed protein product [Caenorhabditis sp. 36 PRJEB53466]|nr:unnamed protein product [Caenorhabditis sp. 36 PRJEB53466]
MTSNGLPLDVVLRCLNLEHNRQVETTQQTRRPAPAALVKMILAEFYTPRQIAAIEIDRKEYGMDNEIFSVFSKFHEQYGKKNSKLLLFNIFKLVDMYISIPDLYGLIGNFQVPELNQKPKVLSKLEKIRNEIFEVMRMQRPKLEPHTLCILEYLLEEVCKRHRYTEFVQFPVDENGKLETVLDKFFSLIPKKDLVPAPSDHIIHLVIVSKQSWPEQGYVTTKEIYKYFPRLESFFESPIGQRFQLKFTEHLAHQFPNMQKSMLDRVNAYTNEYFIWLQSIIFFEESLAHLGRWMYHPRMTPFQPEKGTIKLFIRVIVQKVDGVTKRCFIFLDECRFIFEQLVGMGVDLNRDFEMEFLSRDGPNPVVHKIAEITDWEYARRPFQMISSITDHLLRGVQVDMHTTKMTNGFTLPTVSAYNTHCIPSIEAFRRIVDILVREVQVGKRIPLLFQPLMNLLKKMEPYFGGTHVYKTMIDRRVAHELIQEASDLKDKFNGKLANPKGKLAAVNSESTENDRMDAFLSVYRKFRPFVVRHQEQPASPVQKDWTPPGEPTIEDIIAFFASGKETNNSAN